MHAGPLDDVVEHVRPALAPAWVPGRHHVAARLRLVLDFYSVEALVLTRLPLSLSAFQRAAAVAMCLLGAAAVATISLGAVLVAALLRGPDAVGPVLQLVAFTNVYLGLAYALGELATRRRFRLSDSPNRDLMRALDVGAHEVFLVYAALPTAGFFGLVLLGNAAALLQLRELAGLTAGSTAGLLLFPVGLFLVVTAGQARAATRPASGQTHGPVRSWCLVLSSFSVGVASGVLVAPAVRDTVRPRNAATDIDVVLTWMLVVAVAMTVLGAVSWRSTHRTLRESSFVLTGAAASAPTTPGPLHRRLARASPPVSAFCSQWRSSWASLLVHRTVTSLCAMLAAVVGLRITGALELSDQARSAITQGAEFVTYALVLGIADVLLNNLGAVTLGGQLRYAWEAGLDAPRMARSLVGLALLPVSAVATLVSLIVLAATGMPSLTPLLLAAAVMSASIVAECVIPPVRNADGSTVPDAVSAVLVVALTAPVVGLLVWGGLLGVVGAIVCAGLCARGATACLQYRILRHH